MSVFKSSRRSGILALLLSLSFAAVLRAALPEPPQAVEQWGIFELALQGPSEGNPFLEVDFSAEFTNGTVTVRVPGFYDGDGVYRVRFMPETKGEWRYVTRANRWGLTGKLGTFVATAPQAGNHGPVRVHNTYHFAYADGTSYKPFGTTSYSWVHRPVAMQEQTLQTLAAHRFNKIRMAVLPQDHGTKYHPTTLFPFVGTPPTEWDFTRFNPEFFQNLELRVGQLRELGIECDLILFHPYGKKWNFETMSAETDERYLRYVVARLAAYRNIWWSLGNEYDFLRTKTEADWDRFFQIVQQADPHNHLRSIHNGFDLYNNNHPWVTHASIQNGAAAEDAGRAQLYRDVWRKPVVYDEVKYEGDCIRRWGNLSAPELVHRFWSCVVVGTYASHSEYFEVPEDLVWLGQGVRLLGQSPARIAFLRQILEEGPAEGVEPSDKWQEPIGMGGKSGEYYLVYFGREAPAEWAFQLFKKGVGEGMRFQVDLIDAWEMTITPLPGEFVLKRKDNYHFVDVNERTIALGGKPYQALRIRRLGTDGTPIKFELPTE